MKLDLLHNNQPISLTVERDGDSWRASLPDGLERRITARRLYDGMVDVRVGDRAFRAAVAQIGSETHVSYDGQVYVFGSAALGERSGQSRKTGGDLSAPMAGVVADVMVKVGDVVSAYQPVAVVEAMKVMATIEAPVAGRVADVCVAKGQRVTQGEVLLVVTPAEEAGE